MAQSVHPDLPVFFKCRAKVSYLPPFEAGAPEVVPVLYGTWNAGNSQGLGGNAQPASLSLTDPDAPLVPDVAPE